MPLGWNVTSASVSAASSERRNARKADEQQRAVTAPAQVGGRVREQYFQIVARDGALLRRSGGERAANALHQYAHCLVGGGIVKIVGAVRKGDGSHTPLDGRDRQPAVGKVGEIIHHSLRYGGNGAHIVIEAPRLKINQVGGIAAHGVFGFGFGNINLCARVQAHDRHRAAGGNFVHGFVSRRDNLSYHAFDFVSMERYTARSIQSENGTLPSLAI